MQIDNESLINKIGSAYKLVILTALRASELTDGAAKLVDAPIEEKVINIALKEITEGKISYKVKGGK